MKYAVARELNIEGEVIGDAEREQEPEAQLPPR